MRRDVRLGQCLQGLRDYAKRTLRGISMACRTRRLDVWERAQNSARTRNVVRWLAKSAAVRPADSPRGEGGIGAARRPPPSVSMYSHKLNF